MSNKKVIGLCSSEIDAIRRIEELKVEGYESKQLYAVTKDADFHLMLQNRSGAKVTSAGPSITEKVKAMFTKEKPVKEYLLEFGLSEKDAEAYYKNVEEELILLVADEEDNGETAHAAAETAAGLDEAPLPNKEEAERRQRIQERDRMDELNVTSDSFLSPNQQPLHRDYF
ncbi:MAG TPA: general stress protein [Pseudobacillus sp.]